MLNACIPRISGLPSHSLPLPPIRAHWWIPLSCFRCHLCLRQGPSGLDFPLPIFHGRTFQRRRVDVFHSGLGWRSLHKILGWLCYWGRKEQLCLLERISPSIPSGPYIDSGSCFLGLIGMSFKCLIIEKYISWKTSHPTDHQLLNLPWRVPRSLLLQLNESHQVIQSKARTPLPAINYLFPVDGSLLVRGLWVMAVPYFHYLQSWVCNRDCSPTCKAMGPVRHCFHSGL